MKIYTKGGDKGETSLLGGTRVSKSHIRIHAYGTVDELNSYLGLLGDQEVNLSRADFLRNIQNNLFIIGSILATDGDQNAMNLPKLHESDIEALEHAMDGMDQTLAPLKSFLLPGGHQAVSFCHIARCVCRRAERMVIELKGTAKVDLVLIKFLNRLSDYLFVLARQMSKELEVQEIPWEPKH